MMASQTIKEKIVELQKSKQKPQNSRPKIQKVPHYLRNRNNFEKHYTPKLVSIGPIHHGNENLKLGEEYKLMWASKYIENTGLTAEDLHKKIADNIDELKCCFSDDVLTLTGNSLQGFGCLEEKLSWMLFVDGCSLLYVLEKININPELEDMNIKHMNIKLDQLVLVMVDALLLENQLPYQVLKLLWKDNNENELIKCMKSFPNFLRVIPDDSQSKKEKEGEGEHSVSIPLPNESQSETPTHLLDLQRKIILGTSKSKTKSNEAADMKWSQKLLQKIKILELLQLITKWIGKISKPAVRMITYRNIQDLKAVGIRLKSSMTQRPTDIYFSEGWFAAELTLPMIILTDGAAPTFLNLIAYEMCPDFKNDYGICSYVSFMESLIDHPEDVKELRSKGILVNLLGSDEEVADLFNMISIDLIHMDQMNFEVRWKIHNHYCNKYKTWIAQRFHTHFSNPWAITAFLAAFFALALTFIQTWFTVNPASK